MDKEIKSGNEILDEFFEEIKNDENLDPDTMTAITDLYGAGKLTGKNLTNALSELRENNGKNK